MASCGDRPMLFPTAAISTPRRRLDIGCVSGLIHWRTGRSCPFFSPLTSIGWATCDHPLLEVKSELPEMFFPGVGACLDWPSEKT